MLQLGEGIGLAGEVFVGFDPLLGVDKVIDHLLERAWTIGEALVARQVNHPHPTAAEQPLNLITIL